MNIIITAQILATLLMLAVIYMCISYAARNLKLKRLFSNEYVRVINRKTVRKLYPFVPKPGSRKSIRTKHFLTSTGWKISVEGIYLLKWGMFAVMVFMLVTIQTTNASIELKDIVQDINYNHNIIETLKAETEQNIVLEKHLYILIDKELDKSEEIYNKQRKQIYIEKIERLLSDQGLEVGEELRATAQRLYYKVLQTRMIRSSITPYVYIILFAILVYHLPDILGQVKRKLIEDKKNWEILNCMIVFSTFGRMPPYSVLHILEHMEIATEVYKPLLRALIEGLKKGGRQAEAFDAALESVDRDELFELIETMKLAKVTGLVNSVDDIDETITNTIKWIEIENIKRRRVKMLYAMSAMAVVMGLGCIYFAYGLTIISNPANMLMK
ncbi:MAG TPA: hypothetical protein VEF53_16540 [Patescibacteria group bacterium]|nr:hypothetical protein [Patescibacteria group bacterium]